MCNIDVGMSQASAVNDNQISGTLGATVIIKDRKYGKNG